MIRMKNDFMLRKGRILTWIRILFFLAAKGATRDGAFLLSEAELMRVGPMWHIWTSVEPKWEIDIAKQRLGLQCYRRLSWQEGQVLYPVENGKRSWSVKKDMVGKEGKNKYNTSEIGWKSGISSRQRGCTGTLKMWSWSSCHQEVKEGCAIVIGTKGLGA
jgi:hypothetical protein